MNEQSDNTRKNILREAQRQIIRSAFFALAALAVIVFACYAWFVSSGTVTAKGVAVRIDGSSFELGSVGGSGNLDEILLGLQTDDPVKEGNVGTINDITMTLTGESSNILWKVRADNSPEDDNNENSHLENCKGQEGISPGSSGKLEFYVIPKKEGELKIKFNVSLMPLNYTGTQVANLDDPTLNKLLQGHFLFFYSCTEAADAPQKKLLKYDNHSFSLTFPNTSGDPILVTIDWLWPEFLRDVVDNRTYGAEIRTWIEAETNGSGTSPRNYFFYNNGQPIEDYTIDNDFRKLNSYYNNGDEYIGSAVKSVVLKLTAEET